jgi:LmbE family N-acetylglucosaminyl deacetylase
VNSSSVYRTLARGAHAVQPRALAAWRRLTVVTARDDTQASARRSCLVVAPHPDDETLGCGAAIARKRAVGTPVTVVIAADGRYAQARSEQITAPQLASIRTEEAIAACAALGVDGDEVVQLGYEDTRVAVREADLADDLYEVMAKCQPAEVLVISRLDHHPDHRAVNRAAHTALARWDAHPVVREFPVWSWIDGPWLDQRERSPLGRAGHLFGQPLQSLLGGRATTVATEGFLTAKRAALAAHASQTSAYTDEPAWAVMDESMLSPFLGEVEVFLPAPRRTEGSPRC